MGYFEGLADASFKTDIRGRHLFYPWGILGKGFVLPDPETYRAQRRFFIRMYMGLLPAMIIAPMIHIALSLVMLVAYAVWYWLYIKKITRYWPHAEEKLKMSEAYENSARGHGLGVLIFLLITSLLLTLGGLALITADPVMAMLCGGFFGLCSLAIGNMVRLKLRDRKDTKLKN